MAESDPVQVYEPVVREYEAQLLYEAQQAKMSVLSGFFWGIIVGAMLPTAFFWFFYPR